MWEFVGFCLNLVSDFPLSLPVGTCCLPVIEMLPRIGLVGGCQGCFLYALLCNGGELWGPIAEIAQWTRVRAKVMISVVRI